MALNVAGKPVVGRLHDLDQAMAEIEKGQQLAGHFPNTDALDRARRILAGEITEAEAHAEIEAELSDR